MSQTRRRWRAAVVVVGLVSAGAPGAGPVAGAPGAGPVAGAGVSCPSGQAQINVANRRRSATATTVVITGKLLAVTCAADAAGASSYTRHVTIPARCSGSCSCGPGTVCRCQPDGVPLCELAVQDLSPGEWLHAVQVPATGQNQYRRSLVMGDPSTRATVHWSVYESVLTVTSDLDDGSAGTLRRAIAAASGEAANPPTLVQFDHDRFPEGRITVRLTNPAQLRVLRETVIDGTDAEGNPSPLSPFSVRAYPTVVEQDATDKAAANAATLRFNSAESGLRGVYVRRILGADDVIARRDQDVVAFGNGARRGFIESSRLDGGSAHRVMQDCPGNTPATAANPAQGKDCIDVEDTGNHDFAEAVVVSQTELRHCYDRAVKSQNAATIVRDSWVHHNLRGGLFAQNRGGKLHALRNLVEENGKNCPSATRCRGGPRDGMSCCPFGLNGATCAPAPVLPAACPGSANEGCGGGTCVPVDNAADVSAAACGVSGTRRSAAQLSAQGGGGAYLRTQGNVLRNGMRNGIFYRDASTGSVEDDFVCGMQFGIETTTGAGRTGQIVVGGAASALNTHAGVLLNRNGATVADITFGDASAHPPRGMRNAFTNNGTSGGRSPANFNAGAGTPTRTAEGNQWQHGGDGSTCRVASVTARDVAPARAQLDVAPCQAQRNPNGGTAVTEVFPRGARTGAIVHIAGTGFNAIEGYGINDGPAGATTCATLAAGNTCGPVPRGTCVEFERQDGGWSAATGVLAVTPTHLVVASPIDCAVPGKVRVRRKLADGRVGTFTSPTAVFCRNE